MLYEFEPDHNAVETNKNNCCTKGKGAVVLRIVNRWFMKFHTVCKSLEDQAQWGKPKTIDSQTVLQAIETNPTISTRWVPVSSEPEISQFNLIR